MEIRKVRPDPNAAGMKDDDLLSQEILKRRAIQEAQSNDYPVYDSTKEVASPSELIGDQLEALAPKKYEINPDLANYLTQMRAGKDEAAAQERKQNSLFQAFDAVGQARANEWGGKYSPIGDTGDSAQKAAVAAEGAVNTANLKDIQGHIDRRGDIARALASRRGGDGRPFQKESRFVTESGKPVKSYDDPNTGDSVYKDGNGRVLDPNELLTQQEYMKKQTYNKELKDKQTTELSDDLAPLQGVLSDLATLELNLGVGIDNLDINKESDFTKDTRTGKEVDLPGMNIPLLGRQSFYTAKGRDLNKDISRLFNKELKTRSGAAVTSNELERLKSEFAEGRFNTEAELLGALTDYKRAVIQAMSNREGAAPDNVRENFYGKGTTSSRKIPNYLDQSAQPAPQAQPTNTYPKTVYNGSKKATVQNAQEEAEANSEGFK